MSIAVKLEWDSRELKVWRNAKVDFALARALTRAGADAIRAMRAQSKRMVRERKRIKAKYLADKALPLTFPRGKAISDLAWRMDVSGRPVPLGEYPSRQTKKGVSVEVTKGRRKLLESAFIRPKKGGGKGVFKRPGKERYPMGHRLGSRVSDVFGDNDFKPQVFAHGQKRFGGAFKFYFERELGRLK
jgi:Prophage minor tail protein Z (GPZ)